MEFYVQSRKKNKKKVRPDLNINNAHSIGGFYSCAYCDNCLLFLFFCLNRATVFSLGFIAHLMARQAGNKTRDSAMKTRDKIRDLARAEQQEKSHHTWCVKDVGTVYIVLPNNVSQIKDNERERERGGGKHCFDVQTYNLFRCGRENNSMYKSQLRLQLSIHLNNEGCVV